MRRALTLALAVVLTSAGLIARPAMADTAYLFYSAEYPTSSSATHRQYSMHPGTWCARVVSLSGDIRKAQVTATGGQTTGFNFNNGVRAGAEVCRSLAAGFYNVALSVSQASSDATITVSVTHPEPDVAEGAPLIEAREDHSTTALMDGRILVAGGISTTRSAEIFDPRSETWTRVGDLNVARWRHVDLLLPDGRVLVFGGSTFLAPTYTAEIFDPASGRWTLLRGISQVRSSGGIALLPGGDVLVTGASGLAEILDLETGTFRSTAPLLDAGAAQTATSLPDGTVLVTGGDSAGAQLFDPNTERFHLLAPMSAPRYLSDPVTLSDGRVLFVGGNKAGDYWRSTELFDPETLTWSPGPELNEGRAMASVFELADGRVLVAAGRATGSIEGNRSLEILDLERGTAGILDGSIVARSGHGAARLPDGRFMFIGGTGRNGAKVPTALLTL